jgi:TATA-box binding protein (TBP) (component of TFIID and TFIIIB)
MRKAISTLCTNRVSQKLSENSLLVVNHVITVHFGPNIEELLIRMTMHNPAFRLSNEHFPSLITKLSQPKTTIMVFVTGCAVLVGSKSECEAIYVAHWIRNEFEQCRRKYLPQMSPRDIVFGKLQTVNIVNSSCLPSEICPINLGLYAAKHKSTSLYNPKRFPGCKIEYADKKITAVIFEHGNFNMVGGKTQQAAIDCATQLIEEMAAYKMEPRASTKNIVRQRALEFRAAKELVGGWSESESDGDNDAVEAPAPEELVFQQQLGDQDVFTIDDANFLESIFNGAVINLA